MAAIGRVAPAVAGRVLILATLLAAAMPGMAADSIVPIDEEPRHRMMFENPHVRFFDVQLEPGYLSQWHTHLHDGVFINIAASATSAQDYGGEVQTRAPREVGETYFLNYTRRPKAHRVANTGSTPYRVVDVEVHAGCGGWRPAAAPQGDTALIDNDRVRVTRLLLAPGQSATLQPPCGMLVAVSGGSAVLKTRGGDATLALQPANFHWRQSAASVELVNIGSTLLHAIDVLVK